MLQSDSDKQNDSAQQTAGSAASTAVRQFEEEAELLCSDMEKLFKRAFGEIPASTDLGEMRALQAQARTLVRRAQSSGGGAAAGGESADAKALADERDKLKDALARARADFLNYQNRTSKEMERAEEFALRKFVGGLLPVLDNLDLTMLDAANENTDVQRLRDALGMTDTGLRQTLAVRGLERIAAKGKSFDPSVHEAVVKRPAANGEAPNSVLEELRAGYLWKGLLLRPVQVLVSEPRK
jgi:molecular chaperone GrpE